MEIYFGLKRCLQQNKYTGNITGTFLVCKKTCIQLTLFSVSFFKERHLIFIADICRHRRSAGRYYNEVFFVYRKKLCSWFFNNVWQSHQKEMEVSTGIVVCHMPEAWGRFILFPSWADFIWTNNWKFSCIFCYDSAMNEVLMNELHFSEKSSLSSCSLPLHCLVIFKAVMFYREIQVAGKSRYRGNFALPSTSAALIRADHLWQIKHWLIEQTKI